jgi:CheY-like chemotaxis protein
MTEGRVLVVDDEPAIRALVARIVERSGHAVDTARDGAEAIERLAERTYAVVVVDLMMPNVDGFSLIEHIKKNLTRRPAIIAVSAADSASLRQLDGSVVHSVLRKPFDIDVLGDLITAAANSAEEASTASDVIQFPRNSAC